MYLLLMDERLMLVTGRDENNNEFSHSLMKSVALKPIQISAIAWKSLGGHKWIFYTVGGEGFK